MQVSGWLYCICVSNGYNELFGSFTFEAPASIRADNIVNVAVADLTAERIFGNAVPIGDTRRSYFCSYNYETNLVD